MTDIKIPPEAVAALEKAQWEFKTFEEALRAAIMAWPGMEHRTGYNMLRYIILPIPQENSND